MPCAIELVGDVAPRVARADLGDALVAAAAADLLSSWLDERGAYLTAYFLEPEQILGELREAGLELRARLDREPWTDAEYPSRRCYALARRAG